MSSCPLVCAIVAKRVEYLQVARQYSSVEAAIGASGRKVDCARGFFEYMDLAVTSSSNANPQATSVRPCYFRSFSLFFLWPCARAVTQDLYGVSLLN